ncbi:MAG TPA: hypothetical protein VFO36_08805 [Nitrospiraceae bacterium]|nr:hypothetical protein [Nitrospiraceae bacterium]
MSAASIFGSVFAWLARGAPPSFGYDAIDPHRGAFALHVDTFGNPIDDDRAEPNRRELEDRAREHQILISCWM